MLRNSGYRFGQGRQDPFQQTDRMQVEKGDGRIRIDSMVDNIQQQELGGRMAPGRMSGPVILATDVGVNHGPAIHLVAVHEHRGVYIAEDKDGDAEHRHPVPDRAAMYESFHFRGQI